MVKPKDSIKVSDPIEKAAGELDRATDELRERVRIIRNSPDPLRALVAAMRRNARIQQKASG